MRKTEEGEIGENHQTRVSNKNMKLLIDIRIVYLYFSGVFVLKSWQEDGW